MKKRLTVLALAFAMVLTMSASVFAAGNNASNATPGTYDSAAADAKIVKYVQAPEGVTLDEDMTFTFTFTKHAPTNATYGVPVDNTWADTSASIKIGDMSAGTAAADEDTQNLVGTKTIASIFTGYTFPRAGEYTFKVKETAGSATGWTYAADEYLLRLVVNNDKEITDVTVQEVTPTGEDDDPDTPENESEELGDKVDPEDVTPGDNITPAVNDDPDTPEDESKPEVGPTPAESNGGFTFTNLYKPTVSKHDEPQDPNPDEDPTTPSNPEDIDKTNPKTGEENAFELDKFVLGEYGNQQADWTFSLTVTLPKNYKDFTLPTGWTDGDAKTVTLKHGETFEDFETLPVGTRIEVKEVNPANGYTALLTTSKTTAVEEGLNDASATTGGTVLVTEKGGYAICRNSFDDTSITPTGIIINNLPYVLLIGLALGGIVLFSRKRRYE